jgi:hypothetical protein
MNILEIQELQVATTIVCIVTLLVFAYHFYKKFTTKVICPYCKNNNDLERIKKSKILNYIPFMNLKYIKCYKCNKTHYHLASKKGIQNV